MTESDLIYQIMRELSKFGLVYRANCGAVKLANGKYFRGLPEGFSDVLFIRPPDGKACLIEAKVKPNRLTDKQEEFILKMRRAGAFAGVAFSVDDALMIAGLSTVDETVTERLPREG